MNEPLRRAGVFARRQSCEGASPGRRHLLRRMLRSASLVLLGATSGAVVVKRRRLLREGKCLHRGMCRDCEVFDDCGLPRALSTKDVLARASRGG